MYKKKNQPHMAYQSLYLSIFFLSNIFPYYSPASFSAKVFKFYIHNEDNQVCYCKQNQSAEIFFLFCLLFCFTFLAHLSQWLIGELIGYPWSGIRRPQFQTSSPLKPLGKSKPNFIWSLLGKGKFV